jgi:hypothetical protein
VAVIDVTGNIQPRLLEKISYPNRMGKKSDTKELVLSTDNLLSKEHRYLIAQYFGGDNYLAQAWDGDMQVEADSQNLCVYKTREMNDQKIMKEKIAEYRSLPLEKLMYGSASKVILKGDKIFLLNVEYSLTVFQLNESAGTLKRVGHYADPEGYFTDMFLRDDGNIALVGASEIHIVQPPADTKN